MGWRGPRALRGEGFSDRGVHLLCFFLGFQESLKIRVCENFAMLDYHYIMVGLHDYINILLLYYLFLLLYYYVVLLLEI